MAVLDHILSLKATVELLSILESSCSESDTIVTMTPALGCGIICREKYRPDARKKREQRQYTDLHEKSNKRILTFYFINDLCGSRVYLTEYNYWQYSSEESEKDNRERIGGIGRRFLYNLGTCIRSMERSGSLFLHYFTRGGLGDIFGFFAGLYWYHSYWNHLGPKYGIIVISCGYLYLMTSWRKGYGFWIFGKKGSSGIILPRVDYSGYGSGECQIESAGLGLGLTDIGIVYLDELGFL